MRPGNFEVVLSQPWSERLVGVVMTLGTPARPERAHRVPRLWRGLDGALWLSTVQGQVVGGQVGFTVEVAPDGLVPLDDGGVLVLGGGLLLRVDARGQVGWRGVHSGQSLQRDGAVWLIAEGKIARVDLDHGALSLQKDLGPGRVFLSGGVAHQVDADCRWRRDGEEIPVAAELKRALPVAALPDGGLLWVHNHAPIWMAPDGRVSARVERDQLPDCDVDTAHPVVEPDGAVLFACADATGVFVTRLRRGA